MIEASVLSQLWGTRSSAKEDILPDARTQTTAKDFEAMFVAQMLETMFGDSIGEEAFGDAETGEIYKTLMMQEYGRKIASAGGIGIASYVQRELLKLQEAL